MNFRRASAKSQHAAAVTVFGYCVPVNRGIQRRVPDARHATSVQNGIRLWLACLTNGAGCNKEIAMDADTYVGAGMAAIAMFLIAALTEGWIPL